MRTKDIGHYLKVLSWTIEDDVWTFTHSDIEPGADSFSIKSHDVDKTSCILKVQRGMLPEDEFRIWRSADYGSYGGIPTEIIQAGIIIKASNRLAS